MPFTTPELVESLLTASGFLAFSAIVVGVLIRGLRVTSVRWQRIARGCVLLQGALLAQWRI